MNTPVSFKLAKLLKEKEFDEPTKVWHQRGNGIVGCVEGQRDFFNRKGDVYTSAPTIAEVVMWLYEKHEIWIGVICDVGNDLLFTFKIYSTKIGEERCIVNGNMYESPTEAYEAAIEYTLKNLLERNKK
jgi:hypothetical protein